MSPVEALLAGQIVLLNTDSLPGLHALATRPGAADRLRAAKGSPGGRPFLLLFGDADAALAHLRARDSADEDRLRDRWPAPLTALLEPRESCPAAWREEELPTVAARVPAAPSLRNLLASLPGPLFSTSANRAGEPPALTMDAAKADFPDLMADDLGLTPLGSASTVVDLSCSPGVVLRPGPAVWGP